MKQSADIAKIPLAGRYGGLMHDETKLQEDLVCSYKGNTMKLIGLVDIGNEAFHLECLKKKALNRPLATECLQLVFLGYTGFRFPVAHFPTNGVKASELCIQLWRAISKLQDWGFVVDFIIQDGGEQNREFSHMHFSGGNMIPQLCKVPSLTNFNRFVIIVQDFSHIVKKVRNALLSSGLATGESKYTRSMVLSGKSLVWKQWIDAVKWDRENNSRPIHHRVSDSHLFPNNAEKMRNHLAEDMLDTTMLNLMTSYQAGLNDGTHLAAAVNLLEQTSILIAIFRDHRPFTSMKDDRLSQLKKMLTWLEDWEKDIESQKMATGEKRKLLPSWECREDLKSLLVGFPQVVAMHLQIQHRPGRKSFQPGAWC
jgi:hypothetical protein